ncbi:hypothetical protein NP233_g8171 [Leucocoprinus birnbaumii]|uniref:MYND-type domain-containing protein n=1 Tax=Leucocoprinus birnbaumii TaxID=56174 RepID=A0AAD5VTA7_9AGAR|nr:hypothetical protein NP233_g8171 [Leucocoprinus birnbaumii]
MTNKKGKKKSASKQKAPESAAVSTHPSINETPNNKLSHEDLVYILRGMRIDVSPHTKIPIEKLQTRLEGALAAAQRSTQIFSDTEDVMEVVDPKSLPICTDLEQIFISFSKLGSRQGDIPKMDWFSIDEREMSARWVSAVLYFFFEQVQEDGLDCVSYLDEKTFRALIVRVLSVRMINEETPLILVAYRAVKAKSRDSLREYVMETFRTPKGRTAFQASETAQKLLEMYLALNGARLSSEFEPPPVVEQSSPHWKYGFVLPLGELLPADVGPLNVFEGCATCGEEAEVVCSKCENVKYCSKACQKQDFHAHRSLCRAVTSGTWTTITLQSDWVETEGSGGRIAVLNHVTRNVTYIESDVLKSVPKDLYGDKYFLMKLQCSMAGPKDLILVYDVHRSFNLYMMGKKNEESFQVALRQFSHEKRPIFRWAKRVGDWEWQVCFESVPEYPSPW